MRFLSLPYTSLVIKLATEAGSLMNERNASSDTKVDNVKGGICTPRLIG